MVTTEQHGCAAGGLSLSLSLSSCPAPIIGSLEPEPQNMQVFLSHPAWGEWRRWSAVPHAPLCHCVFFLKGGCNYSRNPIQIRKWEKSAGRKCQTSKANPSRTPQVSCWGQLDAVRGQEHVYWGKMMRPLVDIQAHGLAHIMKCKINRFRRFLKGIKGRSSCFYPLFTCLL